MIGNYVSEGPYTQSVPLCSRLSVLLFIPPILLLDQLTKLLVVETMARYQSIDVLGSFFRLTHIHNPGAAFGLSLGSPGIHTVISVVALGVIVYLFWTLPMDARLLRTAMAMVLGGALGNIVDRIRLGEVVDFFDFGIGEEWRWPVFNVADSFITIGILILLIGFSRQKEPSAQNHNNSAEVTSDRTAEG